MDPGQVQGVEMIHGVTRTGLVCDTLYGVSLEGQEFAGQLRLGKHAPETFDTIVSVSKLRYFCPKVSYRYRISIEILYLKSIGIGIGIEISDIKVSVSVWVSQFQI